VNRDELRARQAPVKAAYRDDPDAAVVTMRAAGDLDADAVSCSVATGRAIVEAGLHPASGGDAALACSGDMLLQALVACAGVTLRAVAVNRDIPVSGRVVAEGDLDFRGTLGLEREVPVGFRDIRLRFELESSAPQEEIDALIDTAERYCVVLQTITGGVPVEVSRA
jgi:uncharacterized OsmC-like protein